MTSAKELINTLNLQPHPEGGYYKRTYASAHSIMLANSQRRLIGSAIYYLLESRDFSCWHRLNADETWHYYCGSPLCIYEINPAGELVETHLGNPLTHSNMQPQYTVYAGRWFAATVEESNSFSLVGCTVAPGFEFADFEMGEREALLQHYPQHRALIAALTRTSHAD